MKVGPELDAEVARALGTEVLGMAPCSHEPECGVLEVGDRRNGVHERAVSLDSCCCPDDPAKKARYADGQEYFGHLPWCLKPVPPYSTEIAAAWLVVERIGGRFSLEWGGQHGWYCHMSAKGADGEWRYGDGVTCETAPEAICRAALAAVGAGRSTAILPGKFDRHRAASSGTAT
jgi:hypothetical protein